MIPDAKADLDGFTLEKHHQQTRDRMLQKMKNAPASQPVSATIDGHPALQDELTRTEKGTNVVFLHTTVDDGKHFRQILAWTLKSRWQNPERFRGCVKSPRVSGVKSNVLDDQSAHAQHPNHAPA